MLGAIGTSPALQNDRNTGGLRLPGAGTHSVAALEDQIRQKRVQLNDWVTCVSARTPKGQSEIQSLSAQISAAQQQINHLNNTKPALQSDTGRQGSIDVWV